MLRVLISSKGKNQFHSEVRFQIALITKEIALGLWSWDDLNSEGDAVEGVLGVGGDGSNSLKTVDRLSKSDEVGSDNVVRGFKDVKSLSSKDKVFPYLLVIMMIWLLMVTILKLASDDVESCDVKKGKSLLSKRRRVYNVVSDDDDTVADDNKVYVADNVVNDKKKSIKRATKGKAIAGCDKVFSDVADAGNVVVGNECKSSSTELKSVDAVYKCDKEYEDVPKKRTPSSWQWKIVNRFGC
ncbi:hypothetical protein Tco_1427729 [Tanacetum coccineum]